MNRRQIIILSTCFVFAVCAVLGLYAATKKARNQPNSFLRQYREYAAKKEKEFNLGVNSWYIAGTTKDKIYLGNITSPFRLLITDYNFSDTTQLFIKVKGMDSLTFYKSMTVKIDSPYFYLADGIMPGIFRGKMGDWVAEQMPEYKDYFTQLIPISKSGFAIRTNYTRTREYVLGKLQAKDPHIQIDTTLLQKQFDGFFCTDGMLAYNRDLRKLIYTYYYRNQFIVYDTTLRLDYRGNTIDTFRRADIKIQHIASEGTNTLTYKRTINKGIWSSGKYLYVNSALLAKNDRPNLFPMMSIIDIYDLENDRYKHSIAVANADGKNRIREFRILNSGKVMIGIAGDFLIRYDMKDGWLDDLSL